MIEPVSTASGNQYVLGWKGTADRSLGRGKHPRLDHIKPTSIWLPPLLLDRPPVPPRRQTGTSSEASFKPVTSRPAGVACQAATDDPL